MPGSEARVWFNRATKWFGSDFETDGWVERLLLNETGELTSTEEYVYRYNVVKRTRDGDLEFAHGRAGEWSPELEREFSDDEVAAKTVARTLDQLEQGELIKRAEAEESTDSEQTYWRLTESGKRERERLEKQYRRELAQLQLKYGMTIDW